MSEDIAQLMDTAKQTVLGVVTARINDDIGGTTLMIDSYIRDAQKSGYEPCQAWSQLFASAVLLIIPLMECRATHHEEDLDDSLQDLGMILAQIGLGYGQS